MIRPERANELDAQDAQVTQAYLADIVGRTRERCKIPAIAASIMNSRTVYLKEIQGVRAAGGTAQATFDDFFHIGSCSKSVLALMAARLAGMEKLTWNTRFFEVVPELAGESDAAYSGITLEDLFLCRGGIRAFTDPETDRFPIFDASVDDTRREFIRYLVAQPPASGKKGGKFRHLYSNASYTMASAMLERVSGRGYEELVRSTISEDLGLSLHIGWPSSLGEDQPWGHMIRRGSVEAFPPGHGYAIPHLLVPAGDLSMTPGGYAAYTQLHLRGLRGLDTYISGEAYRFIHFGHRRFSLGVSNGSLGGMRISGFDGSAGTFFCRSIIVPEADFAFAIMMNAGSGSGSMEAVDRLTMRIMKKRFGWWWKFWL